MNLNDCYYKYEIRLKGHLDAHWFEGLEICHTSAGVTLLSGMFDQSALHGLLARIRDLGLVLLSIQSFVEIEGKKNEQIQ